MEPITIQPQFEPDEINWMRLARNTAVAAAAVLTLAACGSESDAGTEPAPVSRHIQSDTTTGETSPADKKAEKPNTSSLVPAADCDRVERAVVLCRVNKPGNFALAVKNDNLSDAEYNKKPGDRFTMAINDGQPFKQVKTPYSVTYWEKAGDTPTVVKDFTYKPLLPVIMSAVVDKDQSGRR